MPLRRSQRKVRRPIWLNDYITNLAATSKDTDRKTTKSGTLHPLSFVTYNDIKNIPKEYTDFLANVYQVLEPTSYSKACTQHECREVMQREI